MQGRAVVNEKTDPIRIMAPSMPPPDAIVPLLHEIEQTGIYTNYGPLDRRLRTALAAMCGVPAAVLTSSGTTAIELALRALTDGSGTCLMPSFTFVATAHAVVNAGLTPFLLDVDPATFTLTPDIVEEAIGGMSAPPAAVVVVSAFGAPLDPEPWSRLQKKHGIPVVFDAAAAATTIHGVADVAHCISLHATKLPGMGEGGAILLSDPELASRISAMTGFGFGVKGAGDPREAAVRGGNYRVSEYAAAVGLAALDDLPRAKERAFAVARDYRDALAGRQSTLQDGFATEWVSSTLNVLVPEGEREATIATLEREGIPWRHWWGLGCHRHPAFADLERMDLSETDRIAPRVLGLPFHNSLEADDIARVAQCLP